MATRGRDFQSVSEYPFTLTNGDVAYQGEAAGIDTSTGKVRPMGSSATQIMFGFFAETLTGDGTKKVRVSLRLEAEWLDNDTNPNNVTAATIGSEVYFASGSARKVSTLASGASKAGRVIDFDATANKVLVQLGLAVTGPTGAAGLVGTVANRAALAAIAAGSRADGQIVVVQSDGSTWRFVAASALTQDGLTASGSNIVITPSAGSGRWIRQNSIFVAKIPFDFNTADAAQLMLVPTGYSVKIVDDPTWDVTTGFTGGTGSAIGVSSNDAGLSTKGDLLGGASGDVTATLGTTGIKQGTVGGKMGTAANRRAARIEAGEYLRFDRITSAYTAGAGYVHVPIALEYVGSGSVP